MCHFAQLRKHWKFVHVFSLSRKNICMKTLDRIPFNHRRIILYVYASTKDALCQVCLKFAQFSKEDF